MLVLTRRQGQSIQVGPAIEVHVVRVEGDRVVLGISAPRHVAVVRTELMEQVSGEVREASVARAMVRFMLVPEQGVEPAALPSAPPDGPGIA